MKVVILLLMSVLAYSQANLCSTGCAATEKCGWTCNDKTNTATEVPNGDVSGCTAEGTECQSKDDDTKKGTCTPACVPDLTKPDCATLSPVCTAQETCTWTCQDSDNKEVPGGVVTGCTRATTDVTCPGSGDAGGICKPACKPTPKSGSSRSELFAPLLVLGTLAKMCISP